MPILVTGGAGFIGSHLVDALLAKGMEVHVIDNLSSGKEKNINSLASFHKIDIRDQSLETMIDAIQPEVVYHLAAQVSVAQSIKNPYNDASINVLGTVNLIEACIKSSVKRIIFSSSAAVYGMPETLPIKEDHFLNPISPYGTSKATAEQYFHQYWNRRRLEYVILRYANVYGSRQDASGEGGVISVFTDRSQKCLPLNIYGTGDQTRDFIYIKDIVSANLAALNCRPAITMNVSTECSTSINRVIKIIENIKQRICSIQHFPARPGDILHSVLCNARIKKELLWEPVYSIEDGLRDMLKLE